MKSDLLKRIISLCDSIDIPTAVFDSKLECVYSKNGLIKKKAKADMYLKSDNSFKDSDFASTMFLIKGVQYCAKIVCTGGYYVCVLFDSHELGRIAKNTDFFNRLMPIVNVIQYNLAHLWDILAQLKTSGNNKLALDMEEYLAKINQLTQSLSEYTGMIIREPNPVRVDCCRLLKSIVNRCNTFLAKCGRYVDFVGDDSEYYICADQRHAICAFVSAVQNSLMYSPRECVPLISLTRCDIEGKTYVVVKIINDNIYFASQSKKLYENDFSAHKLGCGIPMIKHFMEEIGGEFTLDEVNGQAVALMKIPAIKALRNETIFFECEEYTYYDTGIPDFLELQMREVVDLFGACSD